MVATSQDPDSSIPFVSTYAMILKIERKKKFILTSEINFEVLMSELIGTAVTHNISSPFHPNQVLFQRFVH